MLGSSASIADTNVVINTAVANSLDEFATKLEQSTDFHADLHNLIKDTITNHKRILYSGNGYEDAWLEEAKREVFPITVPHLLPYRI